MADKLPYEKITLENGLRIVLVPQASSLAATVLVLVEAGSKYETKDINGLFHFLEHMCFKGTVKRPRPIDIAGELDGMGASYNAFTSQEYTGYYAKVESRQLSRAMDLIADMYVNPVLKKEEIEKEKGVVVEEIHMYEDLPPRRVHDLFTQLVYGDQPAGWDITGSVNVVKSLTREAIVEYRSKHYVASATMIIVAGGFERSAVLEDIKKLFKDVPVASKQGKLSVHEDQKAPALFLKHKESDQTHLVIGCRAFSVFDERKYILDVLCDVVGGGMSSRLFQKGREELGAAYYITASTDLLTDHGYIAVSAGVHHEKFLEVIQATIGELERLKNEPVDSKTRERAKEHLAGNLILRLETSDELAMFYGGQEILEREMETPQEILEKIQSVTGEEIRSLARELFVNDRLNLAVIGPTRESSELRDALRFRA